MGSGRKTFGTQFEPATARGTSSFRFELYSSSCKIQVRFLLRLASEEDLNFLSANILENELACEFIAFTDLSFFMTSVRNKADLEIKKLEWKEVKLCPINTRRRALTRRRSILSNRS
jgi:hypothetical protein